MPVLPLDHFEPFAAVLGVMLYPKASEQAKAQGWSAGYLAKPIFEYGSKGGELTKEQLFEHVTSGGAVLDDIESRWDAGFVVGEIFKVYFALATNESTAARANWENAIRVTSAHLKKLNSATKTACGRKQNLPASRSALMQIKSHYITVAHLWGAIAIRGRGIRGAFIEKSGVDYTFAEDFQSFLTESEILRQWGQTWTRAAVKSEPPLPLDVWQPPDSWQPPTRKPKWPDTGRIQAFSIANIDQYLTPVSKVGRPKKQK